MNDDVSNPLPSPRSLDNETWNRFFTTATDESIDLLINTTLKDRYHLQERIGTGGMGVVFKAIDLQQPGVARAVKMPRLPRIGDISPEDLLRRFEREIKSIDKLAHDYIVKYYDSACDLSGETPSYLVMRYVGGYTLPDFYSLITQHKIRPLSCEQAADVIEKMGEALTYLHERHTLHRDVAPDNIMLEASDSYYNPIFIDLGIVKDKSEAENPGDITFGKKKYASPEQQGGEQPTPASDQYSLAVTLSELFLDVGGDPYVTGLTPAQKKRLQAVLRKGKSSNPSDRYPSVAIFTEKLVSILRNGDRRIPYGVYFGAAAGLLVIGGAVLAFLGRGGTATPTLTPTPSATPTVFVELTSTAVVSDTPLPTLPNTVVFTPTPQPTITLTPSPDQPAPTMTMTPTAPLPTATLLPTATPSATVTSTPAFDREGVYNALLMQTRSINRFDCAMYHELIMDITDWINSQSDSTLYASIRAYIDDPESSVMVIDQYCRDNPNENLTHEFSHDFNKLKDFAALFEGN